MVRKLLGWLGGSRLQIAILVLIVALCGVIYVQHTRLNGAKNWQETVLTSLSHALDQRDAKGALLPVQARDATKAILTLARFKTDVVTEQAKAQAADTSHALAVVRQDDSINRKADDDFSRKIARARADAAALRAALPVPSLSLHQERATGADNRQGRSPNLPSLSVTSSSAAEAAGTDGLPASPEGAAPACDPLTLDERLLATEQALQLDALVIAIRALAEVER